LAQQKLGKKISSFVGGRLPIFAIRSLILPDGSDKIKNWMDCSDSGGGRLG
jgi:hypothetical protein